MTNEIRHRAILGNIAHRAMLERGLLPDFSAEVLAEVDRIEGPALAGNMPVRDLRTMPWCSIDNDDSMDLDQLTVAEGMKDGTTRVLVAVADVDALVKSRYRDRRPREDQYHFSVHRRREVSRCFPTGCPPISRH